MHLTVAQRTCTHISRYMWIDGLFLRHIASLSEMEPSGVSAEVTKSCTDKDHCQSVSGQQPCKQAKRARPTGEELGRKNREFSIFSVFQQAVPVTI